jgi:hypothetical protein
MKGCDNEALRLSYSLVGMENSIKTVSRRESSIPEEGRPIGLRPIDEGL